MANKKLRVMTEKPLNAETPIESLRTWTTDNSVFFKRNQGQFPDTPIELSDWTLVVGGLVQKRVDHNACGHSPIPESRIGRHPGVLPETAALCSKASGNPWTIGGVGNAIWGGVWLRELLGESRTRRRRQPCEFRRVRQTSQICNQVYPQHSAR